jgi:hypothetical protein
MTLLAALAAITKQFFAAPQCLGKRSSLGDILRVSENYTTPFDNMLNASNFRCVEL